MQGFTLANIIISGDNTTFDINVPAAAEQSQALLYFADTKRTAASATNTGCRGLVIKAHGYSIGDTTVVMPYMFDRWAPFSSLRFMDLNQTNNNVFTVTPGDRAKDGIRPMSVGIVGRSAHRDSRGCRSNLQHRREESLVERLRSRERRAGRRDGYHTFATILPLGLTALFELSNENWNSTFVQHNYWMDMVMEKVKGFSFQYVGHSVPVTYRLTSNIVTVTFTLPHGLAPGHQVAVSVLKDTSVTPNVTFGVAGIKTILATPTPTSLTYAETHADVPEQRAGLYWCRGGRILISASRLGGVATLHFGMDHNIPDGTVVGITGIAGAPRFPVVTVIGARDITIPCPGADGPIALGGGTSLVSTFTDPINNFDRSRDQFVLQRRMYAKRTCEMSTILQGVFGPGAFGSRLRVGLFSQPGADQDTQLSYIQNSLGPPKSYLTHIGMATYLLPRCHCLRRAEPEERHDVQREFATIDSRLCGRPGANCKRGTYLAQGQIRPCRDEFCDLWREDDAIRVRARRDGQTTQRSWAGRWKAEARHPVRSAVQADLQGPARQPRSGRLRGGRVLQRGHLPRRLDQRVFELGNLPRLHLVRLGPQRCDLREVGRTTDWPDAQSACADRHDCHRPAPDSRGLCQYRQFSGPDQRLGRHGS